MERSSFGRSPLNSAHRRPFWFPDRGSPHSAGMVAAPLVCPTSRKADPISSLPPVFDDLAEMIIFHCPRSSVGQGPLEGLSL